VAVIHLHFLQTRECPIAGVFVRNDLTFAGETLI